MIRSMTGFGRAVAERDGVRFQAELKSVNHRFFNASFRLPREHAHLESELVAFCASRLERGHLNVLLEVEPAAGAGVEGPRLERDALDRYLEIIESLESLPGVTKRISVEALLSLPGVIEQGAEAHELDDGAFLDGARVVLGSALDALVAGRETEGAALSKDLRDRLDEFEELRERILERLPERESRERERLRGKVAELVSEPGEQIEDRIAQEIVLYADRIDMSEELTRLGSHVERFRDELDARGAVGRKLTFLLQEIHRETNTIGAKANDADIQQAAVEMKAVLEKMREQTENVE